MNHFDIRTGILSYLVEHPDAQDTIEGIAEWWLLDWKIECETARVKQVLTELVAHGFIIKEDRRDARTHYRINPSRRHEIRKLIKPKSV